MSACLAIQTNAQIIPNSGFENWTLQAGGYEDPDNWYSGNAANYISVSKTTDSYSGNFALQIINNGPGPDLGPWPGYASTMYIDTNILSKISAYVKCDSISGTGKGIIKVWGFLGGLTSAIGLWETSNEIPQYSLIDIPIFPLNHYDSIMVQIIGFAENAPNGTSTGFAMLKVDALSKETSSGIDESDFNKTIKIFPNPFDEYTVLTFKNTTGINCTLTIYDSQGKLIQRIDNPTSGKIKIERKNLSSGVYTFKIQSEMEIGSGEFIVQ